jgi:UDP-N-acetylmuramyl pentapeptide phosphotransferase/UDP-N-acetylglucosamine-1-phosphate transferase
MLSHFIVFLILLSIALIYQKLAKKFKIIDVPNHRSSHTQSTVRGGGILFPLAVILWWFVFDFQHTWMLMGLILISGISLLDDLYELSRKLRFGTQFLALSFSFYDLDLFSIFPAYTWPVFFFIALGIINAINFMDGINGITGVYGIVFFGSLMVLNVSLEIFDENLIQYILLSLLVFLLFNFRKKALMFAGDIGSISIAYLMIYFMTQWYIKTGSWTVILVLMIYGIDVFLTMIQRYRRGEKLTEPHRSHLYQLLVNQKKIPHILIAILYSFLQLCVNMLLFFNSPSGLPNFYLAIGLLLGTAIVYLVVKNSINKAPVSN